MHFTFCSLSFFIIAVRFNSDFSTVTIGMVKKKKNNPQLPYMNLLLGPRICKRIQDELFPLVCALQLHSLGIWNRDHKRWSVSICVGFVLCDTQS